MKKLPVIATAFVAVLGMSAVGNAMSAAEEANPAVPVAEAEVAQENVVDKPDAPQVQEDVISADLSDLKVAPFATDIDKYERDQFGPSWKDVDGNGCDTRNDILARDLMDGAGNGCQIMSGVLVDPYTNTTLDFVYGQDACTESTPGETIRYDDNKVGGCSSAVPIDHIFALHTAWYSGAEAWTPAQRAEFANDPLNLVATSSLANSVKNGNSPAELIAKRAVINVDGTFYFSYKNNGEKVPAMNYPFAGACDYANSYIQVAKKYNLSVTAEDVAALNQFIGTCV